MNTITFDQSGCATIVGVIAHSLHAAKITHTTQQGRNRFFVYSDAGTVVAAQSTKEGAMHYMNSERVLVEVPHSFVRVGALLWLVQSDAVWHVEVLEPVTGLFDSFRCREVAGLISYDLVGSPDQMFDDEAEACESALDCAQSTVAMLERRIAELRTEKIHLSGNLAWENRNEPLSA